MRWLYVVAALAGCDKFIALDYHEPLDAPADGHDEDGDGTADRTDNCPGINNDQSKDGDGDGVGDDCDLNPAANDDIAVFYAFDAELQPDWDRLQGTWTFANDQLAYRSSQNLDQLIARRGASKQFMPPFVVEARLHIDEIVDFSAFSLTANLDEAGKGIACAVRRRSDGGDEVEVYTQAGSSRAPIAPFDITATFTARLIVDATKVKCDITSDRAGQGGAATTPFADPKLGPIGFEGFRLSTHIDYVVVYTR